MLFFSSPPTYAGDIHDAVIKGDLAEIKAIIRDNPGSINATDKDGRTPLHLAVIGGNRNAVEFLVKTGADVNAEDSAGETPRSYAVKYGKRDIESILIERNAAKKGKSVPGYASIQGIESQIPGIHITGHPPNPPETVFRFAFSAAFALLILAGILQFLLNRKFSGNISGVPDEEREKISLKHSKIQKLITIVISILYFILLEGILQVYVCYHPYQVFIPDPQSHWKINPAVTKTDEGIDAEDRSQLCHRSAVPLQKS